MYTTSRRNYIERKQFLSQRNCLSCSLPLVEIVRVACRVQCSKVFLDPFFSVARGLLDSFGIATLCREREQREPKVELLVGWGLACFARYTVRIRIRIVWIRWVSLWWLSTWAGEAIHQSGQQHGLLTLCLTLRRRERRTILALIDVGRTPTNPTNLTVSAAVGLL